MKTFTFHNLYKRTRNAGRSRTVIIILVKGHSKFQKESPLVFADLNTWLTHKGVYEEIRSAFCLALNPPLSEWTIGSEPGLLTQLEIGTTSGHPRTNTKFAVIHLDNNLRRLYGDWLPRSPYCPDVIYCLHSLAMWICTICARMPTPHPHRNVRTQKSSVTSADIQSMVLCKQVSKNQTLIVECEHRHLYMPLKSV